MSNNTDSMDQKLENYYFYKPFAATIAGFIVPMVTGTLSACSSGLIIYIISRSQQKLSTTYHRIMALMSAFDIISSIFIALGTIMMPSDTMYKYAGPLLGNKVTCKIQGWLVVFGIGGGTSLNACLALYFVCSIVFKMKASQIRKYIEPFMYIYTLVIALFGPSFYLSKDLLNPNSYDTFCTIIAYPETCDEDKWYDWNHCTWSEGDLEKYFRYNSISFVVIGSHLSLIVLAMSIILWTTLRNKREINSLVIENTNHQFHNNSSPSGRNGIVEEQVPDVRITDPLRSLKYTRVFLLQALMYIGACILTWIFTHLSAAFNIASIELDAINSVLFPLQGFWNLLIFLYDKTFILRQSGSHVSFVDAAKKVVGSPSKVQSVLFYNLSVVFEESNIESEKETFGNGEDFSYDKKEESKNNDLEHMVKTINHPQMQYSAREPNHVSELESLPSDSSSEQKILSLNQIQGVQFLGTKNRRFFMSNNGIRRTGEIEDVRRQGSNSALSIETPKGFAGDSITSTMSRENPKDIDLESFNLQMASTVSLSAQGLLVSMENESTIIPNTSNLTPSDAKIHSETEVVNLSNHPL